MSSNKYLMESEEETIRLDLKTDKTLVKNQAQWAGIKPGMRVADLGFGSGKTTFHLFELVEPDGELVAADISIERIEYAKRKYGKKGITYLLKDIREPLDDMGMFDFIHVRFVLEYYKSMGFEIVKNISRILKPGGILNLIDLDHNCLSHFGLSERLERTLFQLMHTIELSADFDPYVGRKLYSFLYDLNYCDIDVAISPHHLIFGQLKDVDAFNWAKKAEVAVKQLGFHFKEYTGGYEEFYEEFTSFFADPRRFTYTPLISCRGKKPLD